MPAKALNELRKQPQKPKTSNDDARSASILIFISAHAIGSLGFAMSIFAIWLGWLLPANVTPLTAAEEQVTKKPRPAVRPARRPQAIDLPPLPLSRASEPVHFTPILNSHLEDQSAHLRHVCFEDSSIPPITRRNTMPEPQSSGQYLENPPIRSASATATPLSVSPLTTITDLPAEDASIRDSDNSSPHSSKPSSLKSTSCLQKLKLFAHGRSGSGHRSDLMEKLSDQGSTTSTDTNNCEKSARRASGGLTAAWNLSRHRAALAEITDSNAVSPSRLSFGRRMSPSRAITRPASAIPTASTPTSSDLLSPLFLTRKSQKRISAPIPRTLPYGAPYFAAPPMLLENNYQTYLKALPQFEDELKTTIIQATREEAERGRTATVRRVNLNILRAKPRSASADGTTSRRDTHS